MPEKIPAVFIVGPTASGKTNLSIKLALKFNGEIVSADSMQVYKGIPIATAVPTEAEKMGVKHHLMEFVDLDQEFTVADYVKAAHRVIEDIHSRNKLPIVVGGTGLYIDSLAKNIDFGIDEDDGSCRRELIEKAEQMGIQAMYDMLCEIDPETAKKISPNDKKRIIRALEVYYISGKTMSQRIAESKMAGERYRSLFIGLNYKDREKLYNRINLRVDKMLESGLLEEARRLYNKSNTAGAAQAIGHKELLPYFKGEKSLEEAVEDLKRQTRRYAKRQITWFSKNKDIYWLYLDMDENFLAKATLLVEEFLGQNK